MYRSTVQSLSTLCLGTIEMDHAICEPCYKGIGKWSFFYIFSIKFHGKKLEHNMAVVYPNSCYKYV